MNLTTLGDLSHSFTSRQRNIAIRQDISRYTQELATGQVSDVRQRLAGNYSYLTDIERKMDILQGYSVATSEAAHFLSATQTVIGNISTTTQDFGNRLLTAEIAAQGPASSDIANDAREVLNQMIGRLNTDVAGRFLFSGTATDQAPLAEATMLIDTARAAMAGATTAADMLAAADIWFDDPGGFAATIYQGSDDALAPLAVSISDNVTMDLTATDPGIRQMLKVVTLAALADDPAFSLNDAQRTELFVEAGKKMLGARDNLTNTAARIGFAEARVDIISARNAAEQTSLNFAKTDLLSIDPFEAATRLEEVQFQLQSLYTVTARNAQLSLVNFL